MVVLAGTGIRGFDGDLKPAFHASLNAPNGIAVASNGDVYIADSGNNRIRVVSAATGVTHAPGNPGRQTPTMPCSEMAVRRSRRASACRWTSRLDPRAIYVADMGHHRVRVIDGATGVITTIAGDGDPRSAGDGGPARALFRRPCRAGALVVEGAGDGLRRGAPGRKRPRHHARRGHLHCGRARAVLCPITPRLSRGGWLYVVDDKGAVTVVNVSRGRPVPVAGVMTRGQRHEMVSLAGRAIE